ncbi:hypothetical protein GGU11DRAFT_793579 [Lentinula aff. detonsa]|uniref:Rhodopsin domain-containing protein n=1 Tax=Lentinula aff. detonsa TaxID=2804958 RepID=A0AA38KQ20_9AGAR|nr:hypothetical protein GGU10DRAFT_318248 [Lentinula aff. detonsa]KAJ3795075.1 hypothetical protein GGU11DRAFT_793579 [Lentinula aff. detonsa]
MMVQWVQPSSTTNRIVTTTLLGIAQISTLFRIHIRSRSKRLWWDDAWALLTMFLSQLLLIAMWIRTDTPGLGPLNESHSARIVAYWLVSISFTCTLWSARISLIFSVIRLIPPLFVLRRVSEWTAVIFFLMWAGLLTQKTYVCASDRSWYQLAAPQCHLGMDVAIVELVTDIFADVALAVIPIRLLAGVGLSSDKRRMLYIMFCASLLTSIVSIIHAVFLLGPSGLLEAITAQAEAGTALIVANVGILSPYVYRLIKDGEDFDSKPYTYYPSFHSNGEVQMRRIPRSPDRTVASTVRFHTGTQADSLLVSEMELQVPEKTRAEPSLALPFETKFELQKSVALHPTSTSHPTVWNLASSSVV